ncbi:ArsR/SmtB family transcription factor [Halostagnicola kamekurae]|uniref:Helix-turn-helix domain-containing protein n=1 Tax=Halostagnicola kamekurae TaxID=619731 RepID=A0A1I6U458_9EURY|nr:winged helix-turn-helix domain-containing protein [Halostagnicola kamekurae]SFS96174.1 Helix-turn-helix domain-containing protein [Halostagnicola kamekurae]
MQTMETQEPDVDVEAALSLFGDEYAMDILETLKENPSTAAQLRERCDGSKVTIYRRLNSLEDAGLIGSRLKVRCGGNHCKLYYPAVERVTIAITDDGFDTEVHGRNDRPHES